MLDQAGERHLYAAPCSYCQRVAWPADDWIEPQEFYQRGGPVDAVVSHGICGACFDRVVAPVRRAGGLSD